MTASLNEKLRTVKWGKFKLTDVFEVKNTKSILSTDIIENSGTTPYLCASADNNAVSTYVQYNEKYIEKGNCIFIGGKTFVVSYQETDFYSNDSHNLALYLKGGKKNKYIFLFLAACIYKSLFYKYSWGNSISKSKIQNDVINIPITTTGIIDFDFMESFVAELDAERIAELSAYLTVSGLDNYELTKQERMTLDDLKTVTWSAYRMGDLFDYVKTKELPYKAKELPTEATGDYILPCLTSSFKNQGLNYYAPKEGATVLKSVITIPKNSDVYRAYYQSSEFTVLSDAYAIDWKYDKRILSREQYLFLVMCINKVTDLPIYSYKNKLGGWKVVKDKYIQLPQLNGEIDFDFMDTLISAIQKLAIKDVVKYADQKTAGTKQIPEQ